MPRSGTATGIGRPLAPNGFPQAGYSQNLHSSNQIGVNQPPMIIRPQQKNQVGCANIHSKLIPGNHGSNSSMSLISGSNS